MGRASSSPVPGRMPSCLPCNGLPHVPPGAYYACAPKNRANSATGRAHHTNSPRAPCQARPRILKAPQIGVEQTPFATISVLSANTKSPPHLSETGANVEHESRISSTPPAFRMPTDALSGGLGTLIRSSYFRRKWLPGADNCGNFFESFTFCPESLQRRAKRAGPDTPKKQYQHPLLRAYEFQELLEAGVVNNRAEIARRYGLSRARVTQVMSLLHLPDGIQQYVMALPPGEQCLYSGRRLRSILGIEGDEAQWEAFEDLVKRVSRRAGT